MVLNYSLCLNRGKKMRLDQMKSGLASKSWYPEWDDRQRGAAQRILNNALDVLDEYDY